MGPAGLEPANASSCKHNGLADRSVRGGAESGALPAPKPECDPDLAMIVAVWPALPKPVRAGILAMVEAAGQA